MIKKTVAVVFGGCSPEHEVSKLSAANIIANMPLELYDVIPVYITKEGQWFLYDGCVEAIRNIRWEKCGTPAIISPDRTHRGLIRIVGDKVKNIPVDVVFPVLHGMNGEDGTIQGLLEMAGIPYVGCGVLASAASMDKAFTKAVAERLGVTQAAYLVYKEEELEAREEAVKKIRQKLNYPCFVKPANSGSSIGITKANNKKELLAAIDIALEHDGKVVFEKAIKGRELECAVFGSGDSDTIASSAGEIQTPNGFYDYQSKYVDDNAVTISKTELSPELNEEVQKTAVKIFKAVGGKGLARVDFFLEESSGKIIFNEINTMPGFTSISLYPRMCEEMGIAMPELIDKLIKMALDM